VKSWLKWPQVGTATLGPPPGVGGGGGGRLAAPLAIDPAGERIIVTRHDKQDGKFVVLAWGAGTGTGFHLLAGHTEVVFAAAWSPDRKLIATGGADGDLILWDGTSFEEARRIKAGGEILSIAFSPDGKRVAAGVTESADGKRSRRVRMWDAETGKELAALTGFPDEGISAIAFSPDGKTLVTTCGNVYALTPAGDEAARKDRGEVRVWALDAPAPKEARDPTGNAIGPDEALFILLQQKAELDRRLPADHSEMVTMNARIQLIRELIDAQNEGAGWKEKTILTNHAGPVDSVAFAPNGKLFASGGADGKVLIWDAATLKPQDTGGVSPPGPVTAVAFSPDSALVAATREKVTGFFDATTGRPVLMNPPFPGGRGVAFSPDGKWVATSDGYTTGFRSLDGTGGEAGGSRPGMLEGQLPAPVAWSPDSLYLAHVLGAGPGEKALVGMMGVTPDTKPRNLEGHEGMVTAVAWSKDGKRIASGGADGVVIVWDGATFEELRRVNIRGRNGSSTIHALAFAPDGKDLAAAVKLDAGKSVHRVVMIDPETGKEGHHLMPFWAPLRSLTFSPDGKTLLVATGIDRKDVRPLMTPDEMKAAGGIAVWERAAGR
jgi:WD40 repeat protein